MAPDPTSISLPGDGLDLHAWEAGDGEITVLLLHGYLDCGGSFLPLMKHLPEGLHVLAPDFRGHGRSGWVHPSGWYHFFDYARDVRALVQARARERLVIVGHSMGGGVAQLVAGAWPESVERLVLVEGMGPPAEGAEGGPARLRRWVAELGAAPKGRTYGSVGEVAESLARRYPGVSAEIAAEIAPHLAESKDGRWGWRHDPRHRARTPALYDVARYRPFVEAITAPTLLITGGRGWYGYPDLPERRRRLQDRRRLHWADCAHMTHLERPRELAQAIARFAMGEDPPGALVPGRDAGADDNVPGGTT